jgi:hypothetical protein
MERAFEIGIVSRGLGLEIPSCTNSQSLPLWRAFPNRGRAAPLIGWPLAAGQGLCNGHSLKRKIALRQK